jgi:hypothetical protein
VASINDLRAVIIQDQFAVQQAHEQAIRAQYDYDAKAASLFEKLVEVLRPLLISQFDAPPLVSIVRGKHPDQVTINGAEVKFLPFTINMGRKSIKFFAKFDVSSNELQFTANLTAGAFCTSNTHDWIVRFGDDGYGPIADNILSEFLIVAFNEVVA